MRLISGSWADGGSIPERFAAGRIDAGGVGFSGNLNPHLAWSEVPLSARSLVLICQDPDAPSSATDVNQPDREVPADLPRADFFHWVLVDLPPVLREIQEGEFSAGFMPRGKSGPATLHGARHGLNDYTGWFAGDAEQSGQYFGYDGPFPPFNDARVHRYLFMLYALDVERCPVEGVFTGPQVLEAMRGHVLAQACLTGLYTLNRRLLTA
ncbi:YbhB/YbcL family Raf kinase inhibitor-like protein [Aquabacterium sp.]|uniref:YbhB/YbcL family Raf kinase inhibitor-like protein n=1 Tax=Aquabacterium sp. TaxID=1872578 RepID=UPI0035B2DB5E